MDNDEAAYLAQRAIVDLKAAILTLLRDADRENGLRNADISRRLRIHGGYRGGHAGCISRTVLERLESDDSVVQDPKTKRWSARAR